LSMDEQRILEEMERNLAADDPKLASRLGTFGQPRLTGPIKSPQARTIGGVLALALIAAVTVMVFVISPFANHVQNEPRPRGTPSSAAARATSPRKAAAGATGTKKSTGTKAARTSAGTKAGKTSARTRTSGKSAATHASASPSSRQS
jgi:hypothetical protein